MGNKKGEAKGCFASTYKPEVALSIVEKIAEGATLSGLCAPGSGLPSPNTFRRWITRYPELGRAYMAAREASAHSLEEEALDLARELKNPVGRKKLTPSEIRAVDVAIDQLRWSATRRNPKVYSERAAVNITVPIQINTSLDLGTGMATIPDVYSLTATVEMPNNPLLTRKEEADNARREEAAPV